MKHFLAVWMLCITFQTKSQAQENPAKEYRNFPLIISLNFQNLAMPARDLKSNFSHVGISLGTEVSLNGKSNWVQQFQAGFYLNKEAGDGFFTMMQTVYRPTVFNYFYPEFKAGIGWQRAFHPVDAYTFENGNYVPVPGGHSQFIVPLGLSVGYQDYSDHIYAAPFISYQVIPALGFNDAIPLNFYSLFQFGTRIHFK